MQICFATPSPTSTSLRPEQSAYRPSPPRLSPLVPSPLRPSVPPPLRPSVPPSLLEPSEPKPCQAPILWKSRQPAANKAKINFENLGVNYSNLPYWYQQSEKARPPAGLLLFQCNHQQTNAERREPVAYIPAITSSPAHCPLSSVRCVPNHIRAQTSP